MSPPPTLIATVDQLQAEVNRLEREHLQLFAAVLLLAIAVSLIHFSCKEL